MRIGKILLIAVTAAFFLLLLSALIVSPAPDAALASVPASPADLHERFVPFAMPAPDSVFTRATRLPLTRMALLPLISLISLALCLKNRRDANGRVLSAKRYENSFYPVFRQEIAGG